MRVLLADDEPKVRSALRLILEQLRDIESVDEVEDAQGLENQLRNQPPDLLLVDWELPGLHPWDTFFDLRRRYPFKVIVLSGRCPAPVSAVASGADACLSKCVYPDQLFATLKSMGAD